MSITVSAFLPGRIDVRVVLATLLLLVVSRHGMADASGDAPVKVFVLAGQSNMVGAGQIKANPERNDGQGSLEWMVESSPLKAKVRGLRDSSGEWIEREDVRIWNFGRTGGLKPGYGSNLGTIGPELGFGTVVGEAFDEPVLLIKIAWGGKSIGKDFRPPSGAIRAFQVFAPGPSQAWVIESPTKRTSQGSASRARRSSSASRATAPCPVRGAGTSDTGGGGAASTPSCGVGIPPAKAGNEITAMAIRADSILGVDFMTLILQGAAPGVKYNPDFRPVEAQGSA